MGGALGALLLGCGERPGVPAGGSPAASSSSSEDSAAFAARVLATSAEARQRAAARVASAPPVAWPAPQANAGGGRHIDLRGRPDHIHTLERQPDGTWQQTCRSNARPATPGSGQ